MHWGPAHGKPWPKLGVEGYDSCDSISHKLRPRYSAEAARSDWGCSPPLVVSPELSLKSGHPEERAGASGQGYGPRTWSGAELRAQPQGCHGEAGVSLGGSLNLNFLICLGTGQALCQVLGEGQGAEVPACGLPRFHSSDGDRGIPLKHRKKESHKCLYNEHAGPLGWKEREGGRINGGRESR